MRLINLFEQQLLEHNVVNREAIAGYVEEFALKCKHPNAQEWFRVALARWLEKDDQINQPMGEQMPLNAPDWVDAAIARGDDLRIFHTPIHLNAAFDHLVDYFNWLSDEVERFNAAKEARARGEIAGDVSIEPPVLNDRNRVLKVTVEIALKKADEWTKTGAKAALKTKVTDVEVVMEDGHYTWVEPTTLEALKRDGSILQNCIGNGYHDTNFQKKTYRYFFLHDTKGEPHVAISYRVASKELDEVKGKQNQPPVGRYIACVANLINSKLDPKAASENYDIQNMGLTLLPSGKLGHAFETGKVVFKIGDVRVFETEGMTTQLRGAGYYDGTTSVGGGSDYSFISTTEGPLFTINVGTNGMAWIKAMNKNDSTRKRDRELVKKFLNEYFEVAPAPLSVPSSSGAQNGLSYLFGERGEDDSRLEWYDHLSQKYGSPQEVGKKIASINGFDCYLSGTGKFRSTVVKSAIIIEPRGKIVLDIPLNDGDDSLRLGSTRWKSGEVDTKLALKFMNEIGLGPYKDFDSDYNDNEWRVDDNIYFSREKKLWGPMAQTCEQLWSAKGYSVYRRDELKPSSFLMFTKGDVRLFEIEEGEGRLSIESDALKHDPHEAAPIPVPMRDALIAALNKCVPFSEEVAGSDLQAFNIFNDGTKWATREALAETFHRFDDGGYITTIEVSGGTTYNFYGNDDELLFALCLDSDTITSHQKFGSNQIRASRNVQWLLNHVNFQGEDLVDADQNGFYARNQTKAILWTMGLFHDTRSDSWKLVQDGKIFFEGTGFRIVKFRNRYFIISNDDGCVGFFKLPSYQVTDLHSLGDYSVEDLYDLIVEFLEKTEYQIDDGSEYAVSERRKKGFFTKDAKLARVEDHFPTETVAELPKGYAWVRKAVDPKYHGDEHESDLHSERFSLVDKEGKSVMRVSFDGEFLSNVTFVREGAMGDYRTTTTISHLTEGQKKILIVLMEKLNKKVLPKDSRDFGYYRTKQGKFKTLRGNKGLEGFLNGQILFDDGLEFRCGEYSSKEWTLGKDDPDVDTWKRFVPIIKVTLDDDGIESVKYSKKEAKRNPKDYMPYLHKLMQIFHTISGE